MMRSLAILAPLAAILGGCATFGTNVEGSFTCQAPDGICAPATAIDDAALAQIADESDDGTELFAPAGDILPPSDIPGSLLAAAAGQDASPGGLKIVFPAHRDGNGIVHARREVILPVAPNTPVIDPRLATANTSGLIDLAAAAPALAAVKGPTILTPTAAPDRTAIVIASDDDNSDDPIALIEAQVTAATSRRAANAPASFSGLSE